jgi:hypothetical protein
MESAEEPIRKGVCSRKQRGMLSYWKKLVRKSLTNWIDIRREHLAQTAPLPGTLVRTMSPQGQGSVCWRKYDWLPKITSQKPFISTGEVTGRYIWQEEGLQAYKRWWSARMKLASWYLVPGIDAVARAENSESFELEDGPRLFHWRWPEFYQRVVCDGQEVHFISKKPQFKRPQAYKKSADMMKNVIMSSIFILLQCT